MACRVCIEVFGVVGPRCVHALGSWLHPSTLGELLSSAPSLRSRMSRSYSLVCLARLVVGRLLSFLNSAGWLRFHPMVSKPAS